MLPKNTQRGNALQICVDFGRCMKGASFYMLPRGAWKEEMLGLLLPQLSQNGGFVAIQH